MKPALFILLLSLSLSVFTLASSTSSVSSADATDVCFNGCSGHGKCSHFACTCNPGFYGEDCRYSYVANGEKALPLLSAGNGTIRWKGFAKMVDFECQRQVREIQEQERTLGHNASSRSAVIAIGITSKSCGRCVATETEYHALTSRLASLRPAVPFYRVDSDRERRICGALDNSGEPAVKVLLCKRRRKIRSNGKKKKKKKKTATRTKDHEQDIAYSYEHMHYDGMHTSAALLSYIEKQAEPPVSLLKREEDVLLFLVGKLDASVSLKKVAGVQVNHVVLGVFVCPEGSDVNDGPEDDGECLLAWAVGVMRPQHLIYLTFCSYASVARLCLRRTLQSLKSSRRRQNRCKLGTKSFSPRSAFHVPGQRASSKSKVIRRFTRLQFSSTSSIEHGLRPKTRSGPELRCLSSKCMERMPDSSL